MLGMNLSCQTEAEFFLELFWCMYIHNIVEAAVQWLEHCEALSLACNVFVPYSLCLPIFIFLSYLTIQ